MFANGPVAKSARFLYLCIKIVFSLLIMGRSRCETRPFFIIFAYGIFIIFFSLPIKRGPVVKCGRFSYRPRNGRLFCI